MRRRDFLAAAGIVATSAGAAQALPDGRLILTAHLRVAELESRLAEPDDPNADPNELQLAVETLKKYGFTGLIVPNQYPVPPKFAKSCPLLIYRERHIKG